MNTAEKIYEQVKALPEPVAREILDFVEFIGMKRYGCVRFEDGTFAFATRSLRDMAKSR
jgi:hypothetical protein